MKRLVLGILALTAAGWAAPVRAADLSYAPRPAYTVNQPLNSFSWAGPYLGGNLGYEWGSVSNNPTKPSGFVGGVQAGYNWQGGGPWVFGIEGDLEATGANDTFAPWKFSNPWFGTVRGRAGYAFGELRAETFGLSESHATVGWTLGAGTEFGFAPNWSAKIEYLFVDLSDSSFTITGTTNGLRSSIVRAGVNYHF
jgi:outer membrane immunogenic protein